MTDHWDIDLKDSQEFFGPRRLAEAQGILYDLVFRSGGNVKVDSKLIGDSNIFLVQLVVPPIQHSEQFMVKGTSLSKKKAEKIACAKALEILKFQGIGPKDQNSKAKKSSKGDSFDPKNKSVLNGWCLRYFKNPPLYRTTYTDEHPRNYLSQVVLPNYPNCEPEIGYGVARSRKAAEIEAARTILAVLWDRSLGKLEPPPEFVDFEFLIQKNKFLEKNKNEVESTNDEPQNSGQKRKRDPSPEMSPQKRDKIQALPSIPDQVLQHIKKMVQNIFSENGVDDIQVNYHQEISQSPKTFTCEMRVSLRNQKTLVAYGTGVTKTEAHQRAHLHVWNVSCEKNIFGLGDRFRRSLVLRKPILPHPSEKSQGQEILKKIYNTFRLDEKIICLPKEIYRTYCTTHFDYLPTYYFVSNGPPHSCVYTAATSLPIRENSNPDQDIWVFGSSESKKDALQETATSALLKLVELGVIKLREEEKESEF